ncbi:hypothetical protein J1N10_14855 [Carboxylicivirga sp. A043]|uniref:hypothetical protein n=1 Tax=Carboxylicivirga litoralis TaxID=2816963 RepID=UPI0021CB0AF6|nr:hypothetical protein [Carboxylicivirga sp. A043]MCU4157255.1 hypothetical protein [Carboxylicivirga sp. A043]
MEHYYQFIEQLAEWFMQLFFDPAYHLVSDKKVRRMITKKSQNVSRWWTKQKRQLESFVEPENSKNRNNSWMNSLVKGNLLDRISGAVHLYRDCMVQLIH